MAENVQPGGTLPQPFSSQAFYEELARELPDKPPQEAAEAVLCALTRKLPGSVMERVEHQVPTDLMLKLFRTCPYHKQPNPTPMSADEFFQFVGSHLDVDAQEGARITRAVFRVLRRHVPERVARAIVSELPKELQELWKTEAASERGSAEPRPAP